MCPISSTTRDSTDESKDLSDTERVTITNRNPEPTKIDCGTRDFLRNVLHRYTETEETSRDLLEEVLDGRFDADYRMAG